jgi:DNA-binding transcriptional LysR family regulator
MQYVVAVAEERNFTRAALRCHVTQPALSRQVADVEATLGAKLFERHTRSVSITKAGHLFIREARRALEQSRRAVSLVQAFAKQQDRQLAIGLSSLADLPRLHTLIQRAQRLTPAVSVSIRTAYTPELILALLRGDMDLAVVDLPAQERGIRNHPLAAEPLVAVLPERFDVSQQPTIPLAKLNTAPLVLLSGAIDPGRAEIDRVLSSAGSRAFKIHDVGSIPELLDEVALQGRCGLLRQSSTRFLRQGVVYKPLSEPIQLGSALAWRADNRWPSFIFVRDTIIAFSQQA